MKRPTSSLTGPLPGTALDHAVGVARPQHPWRCWGIVPTAQDRPPPEPRPCRLHARPGFLTCFHHASLEDEAVRALASSPEKST